VSCVNKSDPQPRNAFYGTNFYTFRFPEGASRQSAEVCASDCSQKVCCVGPSCTAGCRCLPETGAAILDGECDPNPCCPTCDPYILNQATNKYSGSCCRKVYEHDGHGACCPPGRDCCRNVNDFRTDGANGACCPAAKPYCCRDPKTPFEQSTGNCQQWPPAYYEIPQSGILYELNSCKEPGVLTKTVTLPESPFPMQAIFHGSINPFAPGGSRFTGKVICGSVELIANIDCTFGAPSCSGAGFNFCKPPGVTSLTFVIENLFSSFGDCLPIDGFFGTPAYRIEMLEVSPCECNPLP
jgi:hypothetical protein